MFGTVMIVALALTLAGAPSAPPARSAQSEAGQGDARICRGGGQRSLGSHIRTTRRCQTAEQWRQEDEARNRPAAGLLVTEGQNDGRANANPR